MTVTPEGIELKKLLGLESFNKVYYSRVIGIGAYTIYFVFFDSRNPNTTLNTYMCHATEFPTATPFNATGRLSLTVIRPIEIFRGIIRGSLFVRVDLSGRFHNTSSFKESKELLIEDMTLKDFKSAAAMSDLTQKFMRIRRVQMGGENKASKFVNVVFDVKADWVEFQFLSEVTADDKRPQEVDPTDFSLHPNLSRTYEIYLRVEKFFTWVFQTLPAGSSITRDDVKDVLEVCPCKIWCNSPAFHFQGMNSNLTQVGAALFPTNIEPKHWNSSNLHGHTYFLDKATGGLIRQIDFFMNPMASMLNKKLKDQGII